MKPGGVVEDHASYILKYNMLEMQYRGGHLSIGETYFFLIPTFLWAEFWFFILRCCCNRNWTGHFRLWPDQMGTETHRSLNTKLSLKDRELNWSWTIWRHLESTMARVLKRSVFQKISKKNERSPRRLTTSTDWSHIGTNRIRDWSRLRRELQEFHQVEVKSLEVDRSSFRA